MKKVHPMYPIMFFVLIGLYAFLGLIAFWLFYPYPTIVFNDVPPTGAKVLNSPLYPGEALQYLSSFCKNTNDTATVHRQLIDGQIVVLTDIQGSFPQGCHKDKIVASTVIPDTANPGRYFLSITDEFHPNPIRTIQVRYQTEYFDVIPKPVTYSVKIDGEPAKIEITSATTTNK